MTVGGSVVRQAHQPNGFIGDEGKSGRSGVGGVCGGEGDC